MSATPDGPAAAAGSPTPAARWAGKATAALRRYRVMAWVTGVMLLLLVVEMVLEYVVGAPDGVTRLLGWIPFAHGWVYVVYLVTVLDLWSTMRWRWGRLAALVLAGVVPVLSFVVERRVHREGVERVAAALGGSTSPAATTLGA